MNFIEINVSRKMGNPEPTLVNTNNINYVRGWAEDNSADKAVIYFKGTDKYLVVEETFSELTGKLKG